MQKTNQDESSKNATTLHEVLALGEPQITPWLKR
jgi:hypothetical protein